MYEDSNLACLFVIRPRKQQGFADESMSLDMIRDSAVDRMDFIHGSFDFNISLQQSRPGLWQQDF